MPTLNNQGFLHCSFWDTLNLSKPWHPVVAFIGLLQHHLLSPWRFAHLQQLGLVETPENRPAVYSPPKKGHESSPNHWFSVASKLLVSGKLHQISFSQAKKWCYHEDSTIPRVCRGYLGLMRGAWQQVGETILVGSTPQTVTVDQKYWHHFSMATVPAWNGGSPRSVGSVDTLGLSHPPRMPAV